MPHSAPAIATPSEAMSWPPDHTHNFNAYTTDVVEHPDSPARPRIPIPERFRGTTDPNDDSHSLTPGAVYLPYLAYTTSYRAPTLQFIRPEADVGQGPAELRDEGHVQCRVTDDAAFVELPHELAALYGITETAVQWGWLPNDRPAVRVDLPVVTGPESPPVHLAAQTPSQGHVEWLHPLVTETVGVPVPDSHPVAGGEVVAARLRATPAVGVGPQLTVELTDAEPDDEAAVTHVSKRGDTTVVHFPDVLCMAADLPSGLGAYWHLDENEWSCFLG